MIRALNLTCALAILSACGAGGTTSGTTATAANETPSIAFTGAECQTVLPSDTIHDGTKEKQALEAMCVDTLAHEHTLERYLRTDDRRFDPNDAALLVDECVESARCTQDEMLAGLVAWYAHQLELNRLSAASKKLDLSPAARDAFVDRTLVNIKLLDTYLAKLSPAVRAYAVDLPNAVHDARAEYYKANADEYSTLDRAVDHFETTASAIFVIRTDAAIRCGDASKCSYDPLYREATRWLIRSYDAAKMPLEARAAALVLGHTHARRGTIHAQIWASQLAYRKLHPDMKAPVAVTEEDAAPETNDASIEVARGQVASITSARPVSKVTFKEPAAWKRCEDGDITDFEGAIEHTHIVYKRTCVDVPAGAMVTPFNVASTDVSNVKPGSTLVAAVSGTGAGRHGIIAQVLVGEAVIQLGPDKFTAATGDPLKSQL